MSTETQTKWTPIREVADLPKDGVEVETKVHDAKGERNIQTLRRKHNLWWFPDMSMYVYYSPTHWRPIDPRPGL